MYRYLLFAMLSALSLAACAQSPSNTMENAEQNVRSVLKTVFAGVEPEYIGAAPFSGFQEVLIGGQVLYISNDGGYLLQQAQPIDLNTRAIAVGAGLLEHRRTLLAQIPAKDRIVFSPANPQHTVTVFTDIECSYCRRLHQDIPELNAKGIAVEYVAFPRMGIGGRDYRELVSVWCAADPRQAMNDAKSGKPVPDRTCTNPVAQEYQVGQRLGVNGTPTVFTSGGMQLGGYLSPQQMLEALNKLR